MEEKKISLEQKEKELKMFGTTLKYVEKEFEDAAPLVDRAMFAMSILSDAQEAISMGRYEMARQWINKAKYHLSKLGRGL